MSRRTSLRIEDRSNDKEKENFRKKIGLFDELGVRRVASALQSHDIYGDLLLISRVFA